MRNVGLLCCVGLLCATYSCLFAEELVPPVVTIVGAPETKSETSQAEEIEENVEELRQGAADELIGADEEATPELIPVIPAVPAAVNVEEPMLKPSSEASDAHSKNEGGPSGSNLIKGRNRDKKLAQAESSPILQIKAMFLGEKGNPEAATNDNANPGANSEKRAVFQIYESQHDAELAAGRMIECVLSDKIKTPFEMDQPYVLSVRQVSESDSVMRFFLLENMTTVKQAAALNPSKEVHKVKAVTPEKNNVAEKTASQETIVKPSVNAVSVHVLDFGETWLLVGPRTGNLRVGPAILRVASLDLPLEIVITAHDGRFMIISGKQLASVRPRYADKNLPLAAVTIQQVSQ